MAKKERELINEKEFKDIEKELNKDNDVKKSVLNGMPVEILEKLPKAKFEEFFGKIKTMLNIKKEKKSK